MVRAKLPILVTAPWLREQISTGTQKLKSNLRVLDSSWLPSKEVDGYRDFYLESHIPTSLYFDLCKITPKVDNAIKLNIPNTNYFKDYLEELGISNSTHVIAYDRLDIKPSFRTWFLFRLFGHDNISVLNGGLYKWLEHGFPVTTEVPEVERGQFTPDFRSHLLRDYEYMVKNVQSKSRQVIDSRGYTNFSGKGGSGGHLPNSFNIPYKSLYNEDRTFKSAEELQNLFKDAQVDVSKPMVTSCMTAMTACSLIAACFMLGYEDVPLYNGSFTEWSARADPSNIGRIEEVD